MPVGGVCLFLAWRYGMKKGKSSIENQCDKIFKHTRSGSYATRARYKASCQQFVQFVNEKYKMQNLRNLQDKHVAAYLQHRLEQGIASKTLKNDLGAIRYMHDLVANAKYELSDNRALVEKYDLDFDHKKASGDRAWTKEEYEGMKMLASEMVAASNDLAGTAAAVRDLLPLCRTMGLRIAEAVCMKRSQAEEALRTGIYKVGAEAKNGLHREVPLSPEGREVLLRRMPYIERGGRIFVSEGEKAHQVVNRVEKYLERHRGRIETSEGQMQRLVDGVSNQLTFHGLRYGYVQDRIIDEMSEGKTWEQAARIVTKEVGHSRIEILKTYMGEK